MTFKTLLGMFPYQLMFRKSSYLSLELEHRAYWALKKLNLDLNIVGEKNDVAT